MISYRGKYKTASILNSTDGCSFLILIYPDTRFIQKGSKRSPSSYNCRTTVYFNQGCLYNDGKHGKLPLWCFLIFRRPHAGALHFSQFLAVYFLLPFSFFN